MAAPKDSCPFIVGIGASAGGVEALQALFRAMPEPHPGLAFIVITHLPPATASRSALARSMSSRPTLS